MWSAVGEKERLLNNFMNKRSIINPIIMWAIIFVGAFILFINFTKGYVFPKNIVTSLLAILAVMYWAYFLISALRINWKAYQGVVRVDKIIKEGVYSQVRHPIYSADIILFIGLFLHWPDTRLMAGIIWAAIILYLWSKMEEISLEQKFGDEYREYKKRVPMFIPRLFKKSAK